MAVLYSSLRKILTRDVAIEKLKYFRDHGNSIVFTNGCFDLLHPGHVRYLEQARELGDLLVVGVNSDRSVRALKGPGRPIQPERHRAEILAALEVVDVVTIFDEDTPRELIGEILPEVLVKGGDYGSSEVVGKREVEEAGGRVVIIPLVEGYSTTRIVEAAWKLLLAYR